MLADVLNTSKDELYLIMLSRYGVFTDMIVREDKVDRIMEQWKTCIRLGNVTIDGECGVELQCYFGSSTYDSKEFSVLLNGVVSEAKDQGIPTLDDQEIERMVKEWGI